MSLSIPEIEKYTRDGFLVVPDLLSPEFVEALAAQARQLLNEASGLDRSDRFIMGRLPGQLGAVQAEPQLAELAQQILGSDLALYLSRLLVKDRRWNGDVAPHQDMPYFHGGNRKLAIFIPLCPVGPEAGGLRVLAGSHRYGNVGIRGTLQPQAFSGLRDELPLLSIGDVLLMDFLTWHYSEENRSCADRTLVQLVYQPATDGSYDSRFLDRPILVRGAWRTEAFLPYGKGIVPDAQVPATRQPTEASARWWRRWRAG